MAQDHFQIEVITLSGKSLNLTVHPDMTVEHLMQMISKSGFIVIDGFPVHHSLLINNFGLAVRLPTGPEKMDPVRTLASYDVADGTELFMGIEPIEVWDLLFDFLRRNSSSDNKIASAERVFGGAAACAAHWKAAFKHARKHPDEQGSQFILGICYQYNPGKIVGFIDIEIAMQWYNRAAAGGCPYARKQYDKIDARLRYEAEIWGEDYYSESDEF